MGDRRNASKIIHVERARHSSLLNVRAKSLFRFKLMAFKVPHNLRICTINIHCAFVSSVVFTTKHRSSSINSETSNTVRSTLAFAVPTSTISLIVNNMMVNIGRLVNLNTLSKKIESSSCL